MLRELHARMAELARAGPELTHRLLTSTVDEREKAPHAPAIWSKAQAFGDLPSERGGPMSAG